MGDSNAYWAETLTGGAEGALDAINHKNSDPIDNPGTTLKTDDICIVAGSTQSPKFYSYLSTDANAESSPNRIKPDSVGTGTGAWNIIKPSTGFFEEETFENGDLDTGVLTITHGLGVKNVSVQMLDENGEEINYDSHTPTNTTTTSVSILSRGAITGTYTYKVRI